MIDHAEILAEIMEILTDENETRSPEEILGDIVSIVDDYKSDIELEGREKQERDNLVMMGIDPDEEPEEEEASDDDDEITAPPKTINRAFLLTKAKKEYYKKHGLSEEDEEDFSPSEKMKHRKGITSVFNALVLEEQNKKEEPSIYANGPFKKIPGNTSVARKASVEELDYEEDDEVTPAEIKWKKKRSQELKRNIRMVKSEIDELQRQSGLEKISTSIINRNNVRIAELEEELEELEEQKKQYDYKG